jgi:hypothetical protein
LILRLVYHGHPTIETRREPKTRIRYLLDTEHHTGMPYKKL